MNQALYAHMNNKRKMKKEIGDFHINFTSWRSTRKGLLWVLNRWSWNYQANRSKRKSKPWEEKKTQSHSDAPININTSLNSCLHPNGSNTSNTSKAT
jgi:hypothetical protein